jgi:hypothetical protein
MLQRETRRLGLLGAILGLGLLGGGLVSMAAVGRLGMEDVLCGPIASDATWTLDGSPYTVTCDVTIEGGVTLEVEPGVEVRFGSDTGLEVYGTILALGTQSQPVVLTAVNSAPDPGDWAGILLEEGSSDSRLEWCVVEYATSGVHILADEGATVGPTLAHCSVRHHLLYGILVEAVPVDCTSSLAEPTIIGCTIKDNGRYGVYGYGRGNPSSGCVPPVAGMVGGLLAENVIQQNAGTGIYLRTKSEYNSLGEGSTAIARNRILGNGGDGVRLSGDDPIHPRIENNVIQGNAGKGIAWEAVDGGWDLMVVNNTIVANELDGIQIGSPADSMQVVNNIVAANSGYGLFCADDVEPVRWTNDIWDNGAGAYSGCTLGMTDFSADPLFVGSAAGDLALSVGSPCIDAGTASGAPTIDIEGTSRPQGDGFDVGAYEFSTGEIQVRRGDVAIPLGSQVEFGQVAVGSALQKDFAIGNVGSTVLTVDSIEMEPAGDYALMLSEPVPMTVTAGSSTPFGIQFAPTSSGEQTATVMIGSDDPDDNPFVFNVRGWGIQALEGLTVDGPVTGLSGSQYLFTATASPSGATQPVTYTWRACDQVPQVHTGGLSDVVTYVWGAAGVQGITVTAENIGGAVTARHMVTLYTPVHADFAAAPTSGPVPLTVVFTNASTGDYEKSLWDLGDRTTSTLPSLAHTYKTPGVHTITLRVAGPGGTDVKTRPAYIDVRGLRLYLPVVVRRLGDG